ncbi:MAG: Bug family tripartite tricarboxylate transporter substrate binding protein [Gemmatimonas sp.]
MPFVTRLPTGFSVALLSLSLIATAAAPAAADAVSDFYRGKRINLIIGYGTGGGYDQYARVLARFYGDHVPGNPTIVPQNMPGAGSRKAANWLYNVAPKDGTALATLGQNTPTDQALGAEGIQFDVRKFNWIGNMVVVNNSLAVWHTSGVKTIEDARRKVIPVGATGAASPSVLYPQVSNNILGTRFKIISGYPGGGDINLAMERGEVMGRGSNSWASWKSTRPDWIRDHLINILFQVGPQREPDLSDVPLWTDLARNDEERRVLEVLSGDVAVGRPIIGPPGLAEDRVRALRVAFDETMKDPRFVAEAASQRMDIRPLGGEELQGIVARIVDLSPRVVEMVRNAIQIRDVNELPADRKGQGGGGAAE